MCNIVTEFYLYSIVYIYLINSRLDVTHSVRHHFHTLQTLSWCQTSGKSREEFTVIELTHTQHFKRLFERTLNIQTSETIHYNHSILQMQGESLFICGLKSGLEKQLQSKSSTTSTTRASKTEVRKSRTLFLIHTLSFLIHFLRKLWGTKTKPGTRMLQPMLAETKSPGTPH